MAAVVVDVSVRGCPVTPYLYNASATRGDDAFVYTCNDGFRLHDGHKSSPVECDRAGDQIGRPPYLCTGKCVTRCYALAYTYTFWFWQNS